MSQLQFKSYDAINASPESLLHFVQSVKFEFDANKSFSDQPLFDFMQKNVVVGGKPATPSKHLMALEQSSLDMDEIGTNGIQQLVAAVKMAESMDKTWQLAEFMPDNRLKQAIDQLKVMDSAQDLAARSTVMLGFKPPEHSVKAGLMPR